jgi:hypothetical protein
MTVHRRSSSLFVDCTKPTIASPLNLSGLSNRRGRFQPGRKIVTKAPIFVTLRLVSRLHLWKPLEAPPNQTRHHHPGFRLVKSLRHSSPYPPPPIACCSTQTLLSATFHSLIHPPYVPPLESVRSWLSSCSPHKRAAPGPSFLVHRHSAPDSRPRSSSPYSTTGHHSQSEDDCSPCIFL